MGMLGWFRKKGATEPEDVVAMPSPGEGEAMIVFGGLKMH